MKAIILAAGRGTRMGDYTKDLPKGMLPFNGKPLLGWQLNQLRNAGVEDINIVTGFNPKKINFFNVHYFHNARFADTNMIESLCCARGILNSELMISYSDIIYTPGLLKAVQSFDGDIGVAVDSDWRRYWMQRYGTVETDLETLDIDQNGNISGLGKPVDSSDGIDYRYIGLVRFSTSGIQKALEYYDRKKKTGHAWEQSGKPFEKGYMTDWLHELIQDGAVIKPIIYDGGWMEFDTTEDYNVAGKQLKKGEISPEFFKRENVTGK